MSFIMMDNQTKALIDIVENRQLRRLREYFQRFSLETRKKVDYVVMDMYTLYMTLANELFPEAKIIIDRVHIVQRIGAVFGSIIYGTDESNSDSSVPFFNDFSQFRSRSVRNKKTARFYAWME